MGNLMAHVGLGDYVSANLAVALIQPGSITAKRRVAAARKLNQYIDCSHGKGIRCYVLMNENTVIASHLSSATLAKRFSNPFTANGDCESANKYSAQATVVTSGVGQDEDDDDDIPFSDVIVFDEEEEIVDDESDTDELSF